MIENKLFEYLKTINEECAAIEQQPDGNYHIIAKKYMINNDGSEDGWLYTDIPNVRLNENGKYVIESPKKAEIGNRTERRYRNDGKSNEKYRNKTAAH